MLKFHYIPEKHTQSKITLEHQTYVQLKQNLKVTFRHPDEIPRS